MKKQGAQRAETDELAALRESEARHRTVMETASDAIITIDETSTILFANRAAEKIFGYTSEELHGARLTMLMPDYMRRLHDVGISRYVETGTRHISWEGVELPGLHRSGHELQLEISFGEFQSGDRRLFTGIARDISERKATQRRLAAQHAITHALAESETVATATRRILNALHEVLGWELSALWRVDEGAGLMRCLETWRAPGLDAEEFEVESMRRTFARGVGLPGRVWSSGESAWVEDIAQDSSFPRAAIAARNGLHACFAFPIRLGAQVLGAIEYYSRESRPPDAALLEMMSNIGSQIGQFIERRHAEEERARLQEELIRVQEAQLEELSTPMIPITGEVVVMPLVGALDAARAQRMLHTLLEGVRQHCTRVAIIDITGVSIVDTHVANVLVQASQGARLLGTEVVLTGIRGGVARSLVGLGVDLQGITTRKNLQSGIAYALELLSRDGNLSASAR